MLQEILGRNYLKFDGVLDSVVVRFKRKVEPAEVDTAKINRESRQFRMPFTVSTRLDDSIYQIPIGTGTDRLTSINTRGAMGLLSGKR